MLTPQNELGSVSGRSDFGLDVFILPETIVQGRTLYGHGGKANGMLCSVFFDPTDRTGVVMLTNGCDNAGAIGGMGKLGVLVTRKCYQALADESYTFRNPWLVTE